MLRHGIADMYDIVEGEGHAAHAEATCLEQQELIARGDGDGPHRDELGTERLGRDRNRGEAQ